MKTILRIISGTIGAVALIGTVFLVLKLLGMEPDRRVLLAGYTAIGGILLGVYLLFYAVAGDWRPNRRSE